MEITDVQAYPIRIGLESLEEPHGICPYYTGRGITTHANRTLVRVETANGTIGWGEMHTPLSPAATKEIIETDVAEVALGRSLWDVWSFSNDFTPSLYFNVDTFAAAVEMAMWDALGKAVGEPIHRLLGGKDADHVEFAYCFAITNTDMAVERVETAVKEGFTVLKTKVGGYDCDVDADWYHEERTLESDVSRLVAMDEAADDDLELRADANQTWTLEDTVRAGSKLEDVGIYLQYLEQPIRIDNVGNYARLRERLRTPIGVNEDLYFPRNFFELIKADAVDVGVIDMVPVGGIVPMRKLAAVAEEANISLAHHCGFDLGIKTAAMLHVISTTPAINLPSDTVYYGLTDHVIESPFEFENGTLAVPNDPGLGISVDEEQVKALSVL